MSAGRFPLVAALLATGAQAFALPAPPQGAVCPVSQPGTGERQVDKERLVIYLLDAAGVSRNPERWAREHRQGFENISPAMRILVEEDFCERAAAAPLLPGEIPTGAPVCTETDQEKLYDALATLRILLGTPGPVFANPTAQLEPQVYLTDSRAQLICRNDERARRSQPPRHCPGLLSTSTLFRFGFAVLPMECISPGPIRASARSNGQASSSPTTM